MEGLNKNILNQLVSVLCNLYLQKVRLLIGMM